MNIFKILASGDGSIKEPNISAFIGYLLNPKEDHGLGDSFLKKILSPFFEIEDNNPIMKLSKNPSPSETNDEDNYIIDLGVNTHFDVEVVLEKAFKNTDQKKGKKSIVDILIKIIKKEKKGKEDVSYLFNREDEPIALILVENKIKKNDKVIVQLSDQYDNSLNFLPKNIFSDKDWEIWKNKICTVLITPTYEKLDEDFERFKKVKNKNAIYHTWENDRTNGTNGTIISLLEEILTETLKGKISPIPSYTADTLRAFINFIESGFSSDVDDRQRGIKYIQKTYKDLSRFLSDFGYLFSEDGRDNIKKLSRLVDEKYKDELFMRYSKGHPISVFPNRNFKNGTKIIGLTRNLKVQIMYRNLFDRNDEKKKKELKEFLKAKYNVNDTEIADPNNYFQLNVKFDAVKVLDILDHLYKEYKKITPTPE